MIRHLRGVLKGKRIELDVQAGLPDGSPVTVHIDREARSPKKASRSIDAIVRDSMKELIADLQPGGSERSYQIELAVHILTRLRGFSGLDPVPKTYEDLMEHANVMRYWSHWKSSSGPRVDLLVWRPKDAPKCHYPNLLPLRECVAVELKIEDGDAGHGADRLKWLPHACRPLGLPVPPDETGGRDYTETETTLIALRAYRELVGIGGAYLLLIGERRQFKLRMLDGRVRIFEDRLWRESSSTNVPCLFAEIGDLWVE